MCVARCLFLGWGAHRLGLGMEAARDGGVPRHDGIWACTQAAECAVAGVGGGVDVWIVAGTSPDAGAECVAVQHVGGGSGGEELWASDAVSADAAWGGVVKRGCGVLWVRRESVRGVKPVWRGWGYRTCRGVEQAVKQGTETFHLSVIAVIVLSSLCK